MNSKCSSKQGYSYQVSNLGSQNHFVRAAGSVPSGANTLFVHPTLGSDTNSGTTRASPLSTIQNALLKFRADSQDVGTTMRTIVLMSGKHRLTEPIVLNPSDSFITFQGETGAILTGSISLEGLAWQKTKTSIMVADIPQEILTHLGPLSVLSDGENALAIRAQHPNKNSFLQLSFIPKGGNTAKWLHPRKTAGFSKLISETVTNELTRYKVFSYASNGSCNGVFSPPTGFFCHPQADADGACRYNIPNGVKLTSRGARAIKLKKWRDRSTAYVHALHPLKWGGWSFRVGGRTHPKCRGSAQQSALCFTEGGFQEARGDCRRGGGEWYVENVLELLDSPGEFFLDLSRAKLFYYPPRQAMFDPSKLEIGSRIQQLIEVRGTSDNPVRNVRFFNIEFSRTYPTHMEPHETPSGGDWSVHRGGALFLEGISDVIVADCKFSLLGSNALFLSKLAHNVRILRNDFFALDGTGILLVGDPKYHHSRPWDRTSDEDYVSDVIIRNNIISDVGLRELQAAGIFGSISTNVLLQNNVVFNGPRAGIIFNDLFGGNINTIGNLLFNVVRVTRDHGPYNVWDRQKWLLPPGAWTNANTVKGNFIIGNEWGSKLVDLDDGARNHVVENNLLAYGNMKLKGYNHTASRNIVIAALGSQVTCVEISITDKSGSPKYEWSQNTCYATSARIIPYKMRGAVYCGSNEFYTRANTYSGFPSVKAIDSCGTLTNWLQTKGQDVDTVFDPQFPSINTIISTSKQLLQEFFDF